MRRLVLVDTADQLPGLLPLHSWSALMSSELVLIGSPDHPLLPHLQVADLRVEVVPEPEGELPMGRMDLLAGLSPQDKARSRWILDRVGEVGEAAYVMGRPDAEGFTRTLGMDAAREGIEVEVVYFAVSPRGVRTLDLVSVMDRLRSPGGCPWDAQQDHASLARYAVEEVYELVEAIEAGDPAAIREELGDVLLQVVFHARVAEEAEEGAFTIDDVAGGIVDKLIRRHPHVFGDTTVSGADDVIANWEQLKAAEKPERTGVFDGVPTGQPALQYATALQRRAAKLGFEWSSDAEAADRVRAELDELLAADDDAGIERELGDLLLSVIGLARRHGVDAELALRGSARRFRERVEHMVAADGRPLHDLRQLGREEWLALWDAAKAAEAAGRPASGAGSGADDPG